MKNIGDTIYWVEAYTNYGKPVPCPMCFGKRFVTIILGDESKCEIECGMCSHGYERASGIAKTWEPTAIVYSGQITGISTRDALRYEVGHSSVYADKCFDTEELALVEKEKKLKEVTEQARAYFVENFKNLKRKQVWSAGYHRSCIKDAERTIEWHRTRLNMIEERESG